MKKSNLKYIAIYLFIVFSFSFINAQETTDISCDKYNSFLYEKEKIASLKSKGYHLVNQRTLVRKIKAKEVLSRDLSNFYVEELKKEFNFDDGITFRLVNKRNSLLDRNIIHYRYQEYYRGIKVEGGGVTKIVKLKGRNENDNSISLSPRFMTNIDVDINNFISSADLYDILKAESILKANKVIKLDLNNDCRYNLIWKVYYSNNGNKLAWVDAYSGFVYKVFDANQYKDAPTEDYGIKPMIDHDFDSDGNGSLDMTKLETPVSSGTIIKTYDVNKTKSYATFKKDDFVDQLIPTSDINTDWNITNAASNVYQAHWITQKVDEYFTNNLGIDHDVIKVAANCSGAGALSLAGSDLEETFINLGEYNGSTYAEYDIIGHEMGHSYLNGFLDYNQKGNRSLHEGIADMFGIYIEYLYQGYADWKMGDKIPKDIRDLQNPNHPCFDDVKNNGSAHVRGEPIGHWFYLISDAEPDACDLEGELGIEKAIGIVMDAIDFLNVNDDYEQFMDYTLDVVDNTYGINSNEANTVSWAWDKICLTTNIINDSQTWDNTTMLSSNIRINDGGVLTITNSTINFLPDRKLYIAPGGKLVLDNSTLSSCNIVRWEGVEIFLDEDFNAPEFIMTNSSRIMNANTGLLLTGSDGNGVVSIDNNSGFYDNLIGVDLDGLGLDIDATIQDVIFDYNEKGIFGASIKDITIQNCNFISCFTGIYYETCYNADNNIVGCSFNGNSRSIELNRVFNVNIEGCSFNNESFAGIVSVDSDCDIHNGNDFTNCKVGVRAMGSYFKSALNITDNNYFSACDTAISLLGIVKPEAALIKDNVIENNDFGIKLFGENHYTILANTLSNDYNIIAKDGGGDENRILCNEHTGQGSGIQLIDDNNFTDFIGNSFAHTSGYDVIVDGTIHFEIGSSDKPALNQFYPYSGDIDVGNSDMFSYYLPSTPIAYTDPKNDEIGVDIPIDWEKYSVSNDNDDCDIPEPPVVTTTTVKVWLEKYCDLLDEYKDNPTKAKEREILIVKKRLVRYFYHLFRSLGIQGIYIDIETILKWGCERWFTQKMLYKYYLDNSEFVKADSMLNVVEQSLLLPSTGNRLDSIDRVSKSIFLATQKIGLKYHSIDNYVFTQEDIDTLDVYAREDNPDVAYARTLLYIATGKTINDDWYKPNVDYAQSLPSSAKETTENNLEVFPNPTDDILYIYNTEKDLIDFDITIIDIVGKEMYRGQVKISKNNQFVIDVSNFKDGLYFMSITDLEGNIIRTQKVIKNHSK